MLDKIERGRLRASWLRDTAYSGPHKAKRIAVEWDVSLSTAERWLAGELPSNDQLEREIARWGRPYVELLFARALAIVPAIGAPELRAIEGGRAARAVAVPPQAMVRA